MLFSHGVMVCHIIFRGAVEKTFSTVLRVRKRCGVLHRKDMRQSVPVFASQMVEIREILWVWKRKVIRQTTTPHELVDVALAYAHVRHPTEVLHLLWAALPVLDAIDPHVCSRAIERHVVDKAKPMHQPSSAVMPLIVGDAPRCFGRLYLLEQIGVITLFDTENVVTPVVVQGLDVGRIGTQGVFGDDKLEMRMILAQLGDEAFGSIALAIVFLRTVLLHNRLRHQWNHFMKIRMDDRRAQYLVIIGD